jgi:hypothetical protein
MERRFLPFPLRKFSVRHSPSAGRTQLKGSSRSTVHGRFANCTRRYLFLVDMAVKLALRSIIAIAAITPVVSPATEPLASRPTSIGFPTTLLVRGQIELVFAGGVVAFHSAEAFWGPPRYGGDRVCLWPTGTIFIAQIFARTPTTIDGDKTTAARLSPGQWAQVQYTIVEVGETRQYPYVYCQALRIDAKTASRGHNSSSQHKARNRHAND